MIEHINDLILVLIITITLLFSKKNNEDISRIIFINLSFIVIFLYVISIIGLFSPNLIFIIIVVTMFFYSIFNINHKKMVFLGINLVTTLIYKVFVFRLHDFTYRFHTNPDPYGYAAGSGYFKENFFINNMLSEYLKVTGFLEFQWANPTPLISSPWSIPDQQLRYASDTVLNAKRIGFPLLMGQILNFFGDPKVFYKIFIIFGIIFSSLLFYLTYSLIMKTLRKTVLFSDSKINLFLFGMIFTSQSWLILMLLEGQSPQIWSLCATLFIFRQLVFEDKKNNLFLLVIAIYSTYVIYPQILINIILIYFVIFIYLFLKYLKFPIFRNLLIKNKFDIFMSFTLILILLLSPTNQGTKNIISDILNSSVGGAIHIGINNFFELFIPFFNSSLSVREPVYGAGIFESPIIGIISIIISIVILIVTYATNSNKNLSTTILSLYSLILALICISYLLLPYISERFISIDYVWFRYQIQYVVFWIPVIIINCSKNIAILINKIKLRQFMIISFIFIFLSYANVSKDYIKFSHIGTPDKCPAVEDMSESYFYSEGYFWTQISFVVCGKYFSLSDGNSPVFTLIKKNTKLYFVDSNLRITDIKYTKKDSSNFVGQCLKACVYDRFLKN